MATRYYIGSGSDWNTDSNWSTTSGGAGGASFPTSADDAIFDSNSGSCTLDANAACLSLKIGQSGSAYASTLSLSTFALSIGSGGFDCTYGGSATVNAGSSTITCAGNFDNQDVGTYTYGTSLLVMTGNGTTITSQFNKDIYSVQISNNASVSLAGSNRLECLGDITIDSGSTLTASTVALWSSGSGTVTINGTLTGTSTLNGTFGTTIALGATGTISINAVTILSNTVTNAGGTWATTTVTSDQDLTIGAGTYGGTWLIRVAGAYTRSVTVNGALTFTGGFTLQCTNAGGVITFNNSGNYSHVFQGNFTIDQTAGTLTWTKGTGTITFSGSNNQTITTPSGWTDRLEDIVINKTAGNVTLAGNVYTDSFTGTSTGTGKFDPNGKEVDTSGNCSWASSFAFVTDSDAMNGCTWDIGGNFTADGQTLNATAAWYLEVTGTAVASGSGAVAYSDASGFTEITATSWTDNGNNSNWDFGAAAATSSNLMLLGVGS